MSPRVTFKGTRGAPVHIERKAASALFNGEKLKPVAEGVGGVESPLSGHLVAPSDLITLCGEAGGERVEHRGVRHPQRRVGLARGAKVSLDEVRADFIRLVAPTGM